MIIKAIAKKDRGLFIKGNEYFGISCEQGKHKGSIIMYESGRLERFSREEAKKYFLFVVKN